MTPDLQCTLWPDGIPPWLGGSGTEWLHCCLAHDLGASNVELFTCVAQAGFPAIAAIMLAGLLTLGPIYRFARRRID